jgi:hypothetical protein
MFDHHRKTVLKSILYYIFILRFQPTATTLTGSFRVMRVLIPKYQSTQIVSSTYVRDFYLSSIFQMNSYIAERMYDQAECYQYLKLIRSIKFAETWYFTLSYRVFYDIERKWISPRLGGEYKEFVSVVFSEACLQ